MIKRLAFLFAALSLSFVANAHADEKNPDIKYRHAIMAAMSNNFSAMAMLFTGKVDRPGQLAVNARALAESASLIGSLFPAGSEGAHALPIIWEEPEQVAEASQRAADATAALARAAASGDMALIARAFKAAGDSCKGCHERYKSEDD